MSKHSELAIGLFKQGCNCSQTVFGAFCVELVGSAAEILDKLIENRGAIKT